MCGIVGSFGSKVSHEWVSNEVKRLSFRGPDSQVSRLINSRLSMGVARLAMTDPHPRSDQPMQSPETGNIISFNGEIYNYREIRSDLILKGIYFETESDTEVLLKFLENGGLNQLEKLNGMFAFAFYLRKENKLLLARDRLGKKPLYYKINDNQLRWSSSIDSLKKAETSGTLNDISLLQYLSLGYLLDPITTQSDISAVIPGNILTFSFQSTGGLTSMCSTRFDMGNHDFSGREGLRQLIREGVHDRVSGHEKVAISLSGGVDSSIVAYEVANTYVKACAFTARWSDSDKVTYNKDSELAIQIAAKLGLPIQEVEMVRASHLSTHLDNFLSSMEEPNNNPSGVSMMSLYKQIAESGFKLVLTGDGADEIFGGYARYTKASGVKNFLQLNKLGIIEKSYVDVRKSKSYLSRVLATQIAPKNPISWLYWHWIFTPKELTHVLNIAKNIREISSLFTNYINKLSLDLSDSSPGSIMKRDHDIWLAMESNRKLDRVSMKHSIEARSPFQDERVISWAEKRMKETFHKNISKTDLWNSYPELLDLGVRRDKAGFSSPVGHWLRANPTLVTSSLEYLSKDSRFKASGLDHYKDAPNRGRYREIMQLWTLVVLASWCQLE